MSNLVASYESTFLNADWDEEDIDLVDYEDEAGFDPETQIKLRYGFGSVILTVTSELENMSLKDIVARNQEELGFRNINEISVRDNQTFIDQTTTPIVGTEYVLAAVGDSKGF